MSYHTKCIFNTDRLSLKLQKFCFFLKSNPWKHYLTRKLTTTGLHGLVVLGAASRSPGIPEGLNLPRSHLRMLVCWLSWWISCLFSKFSSSSKISGKFISKRSYCLEVSALLREFASLWEQILFFMNCPLYHESHLFFALVITLWTRQDKRIHSV